MKGRRITFRSLPPRANGIDKRSIIAGGNREIWFRQLSEKAGREREARGRKGGSFGLKRIAVRYNRNYTGERSRPGEREGSGGKGFSIRERARKTEGAALFGEKEEIKR